MPSPFGFGPGFLPGGQQFINVDDSAGGFRPFGRNGSHRGVVAPPLSEEESTDKRLRKQLGVLEGVANRTGEGEAVARASARAGTSSDQDAAQFERATRGQDLSARQQSAAKTRLSLSRSLNRASAAGATRRGFKDRSDAAEAAGGGFADAFFSQRIAGQTNIEAIEAAKTANAAQRKSSKKSGILGAVGSVIGGALAFFSSEELKHDHGREPQLLNKLKKVRINRWQYKGDNQTHVGPFSEEFNREFGIDTKRPDMISVIDALGVTLGAVKELDEKVSAHGR